MQYGAPLVIASTFLILIGVSLLRPKSTFLTFGKPPITVPAAASNRGNSQIPVPSPGSPGGAYQPIPVPQSRPVAFAPPPPSAGAYPAPVLTPEAYREAVMFANQQQLNRMALSVDSAMRNDDIARQQAAHSNNGGGIQSIRRAVPAVQASSAASVY